MTFAPGQERAVSGFWLVTLYNDEHFFHSNALERYSLGTKNKNLQKGADGSLTLHVGGKSPGTDKESNWLPAPSGHFSLYHARLLGSARHSRRLVEAAGHSQGRQHSATGQEMGSHAA